MRAVVVRTRARRAASALWALPMPLRSFGAWDAHEHPHAGRSAGARGLHVCARATHAAARREDAQHRALAAHGARLRQRVRDCRRRRPRLRVLTPPTAYPRGPSFVRHHERACCPPWLWVLGAPARVGTALATAADRGLRRALFVPFTALFVPFTPLFAPFTALFVPLTALFAPFTPLFAPLTALFAPHYSHR